MRGGSPSRRGLSSDPSDLPDVIRVAIIAADPLAGTGLASLLSGAPDMEIAAQVASFEELGPARSRGEPDLFVWDFSAIPEDDLDFLREPVESGIAVVALVPDEESAESAWAAGARGLLLRPPEREGLLAALRGVAGGLVALDPDLAAALLPSPAAPAPPMAEPLTVRELEVLELVAGGLTNRAIAGRLGISEHTVKFHLNAILGKLGAQSRTEAVVRATRLGLIVL